MILGEGHVSLFLIDWHVVCMHMRTFACVCLLVCTCMCEPAHEGPRLTLGDFPELLTFFFIFEAGSLIDLGHTSLAGLAAQQTPSSAWFRFPRAGIMRMHFHYAWLFFFFLKMWLLGSTLQALYQLSCLHIPWHLLPKPCALDF